MLRLDRDFLASVGLAGLGIDDMNGLLAAVYAELELRVGLSCAERMSPEQLEEFERAIDAEDEELALALLQRYVPDHLETVHQTLAALSDELRDRAAAILEEVGRQVEPCGR